MAASWFGRAAMRAGSWGKKAAPDVAKARPPYTADTIETAQRSIYNRGRNRLIGGGAAASGMIVLNAARSPSSGSAGYVPQSSGGMTGPAY